MQAQGSVKLQHDGSRKLADSSADPFDRDGADLLRLRFGVATQPAFRGRKEHLKRIDPGHVGGHGHNRDDAAVESRCRRVGAVVAHDHRWSTLAGFGAAHGLEVDQSDFTAKH